MSDHLLPPPGLIGREPELAVIEEFVDRARQGGGTVRLWGDPGVGKSALLQAGMGFAVERGYTVLSVRAIQGEAHMAFSVLYEVLRPVLDRVDELPVGHRNALMSAFGLLEPGPATSDPFFIALAALELLADAAAESPVLVVVDDLVWVDSASQEAIDFISRRIADEQIVMLFACRLSTPPESTFGSMLLPVPPLGAEAARELLSKESPGLSPLDVSRVLEIAAGNPLALLELAKVVSQGGALSHFDSIPLTQRLERAFAVRLDRLSLSVRTALLVAALQDSSRLSETKQALSVLTGVDDAKVDLQGPVDLGMLTIEGDTFRFRHPLVQSAILQSANHDERRAIQHVWAVALREDPDREVWHRALAETRPNESLAMELAAGADRATARGAPGLAEQWMQRAAQLSEDEPKRGHRLLLAAELAFELGRHSAVGELVAEARTLALDRPDRARLAGLEGAFDDGIPGDAASIRALVEGANRARGHADEALAASLLLRACNACYWGAADADLRAVVKGGINTLSLDRDDPRVMVLYAEVDPFGEGTALTSQLAEWAANEVPSVLHLGLLGRTGFVVGDFESGLQFATRASEALRREGRVALLTHSLVLETFTSLYLGRWETTLSSCDEAHRFGVETHQPVWASCGLLGEGNLAGLRGDVPRAMAIAAQVEEEAVKTGNRALLNGVLLTRGFAALGDERPGHAFEEFRHMVNPTDVAYQSPQCAWVIDYLAEAAALSRREEEALEAFDHVSELVGDTTAPGVTRAIAYARALLADDTEAEPLFADAMRRKVNAAPWYCARIDLAYGSWLRRRRRIAECRRPLESALAVFDALGAMAWSTRSRQELAATGRRTPRHEPDGWSKLSAQELQVARLAAQGLTNREIGQRLYLSHRTVGSHLYRAFPKLGVRSRSQLHLALEGAINEVEQR